MPQELAKGGRVLDVVFGGPAAELHLVDEPNDKCFEVHPIHDLSVGPQKRLRGRIQYTRTIHPVGADPCAPVSPLSELTSTTSPDRLSVLDHQPEARRS